MLTATRRGPARQAHRRGDLGAKRSWIEATSALVADRQGLPAAASLPDLLQRVARLLAGE